MTSPISQFPVFSPIGGLPWSVTALLLGEGRMAFMTGMRNEAVPEKMPPIKIDNGDNVINFPLKKFSVNDDDTGPELA